MIKKTELAAIIEKSSRQAGKYLVKAFNGFDRSSVSFKSSRELVTEADKAAEAIIIKEIRKNFPKHRILSEESGNNKQSSDYLWIIDPIDGTTNFSFHNPLFSVSIAVLYRQELVAGGVFFASA
jgi:myo-inositol-1(or 4)-monophosphatase